MRIFKRMPILAQLLSLTLCIILVVFITFTLVYSKIENILSNNTREYINEMFGYIKQATASNCSLFEHILYNIAFDSKVQHFISDTDLINKWKNQSEIERLNNNMTAMKEGIIDIVITGNNGSYYYYKGKTLQTEKVINKLSENLEKNYFSEVKTIEYNGRLRKCIVLTMPIVSLLSENSGQNIGRISLILDSRVFSLENRNFSTKLATKYYLLDRNGYVFSSNDGLTEGKKFEIFNYKDYKTLKHGTIKISGKNTIIRVDDLEQINGKIISIVPEKDLFSDLAVIKKLVLIIFVLLFIIFSIPFTFVFNNILQPINSFIEFTKKLKSGNLKNLKKRIQVEGNAEIVIMANEFNEMLDEVDNLTHRLIQTNTMLYEAELEKKQAELAFLQSQVNPHFLYNTLEAIIGIAAVAGNYTIIEIVKSLSQIFRYSIKEKDFVTLRDEIEIVKAYIKIQQIRFQDRFEVIYDINETAMEALVPKMLLQPVVENSIKHGLEPQILKGHLWIVSEIIDDVIIVTIKDDGIGIKKDILEGIRGIIDRNEQSYGNMNDKRGIGVLNVANRIRLVFGEKYALSISSEPDKGTEVILKLPLRSGLGV